MVGLRKKNLTRKFKRSYLSLKKLGGLYMRMKVKFIVEDTVNAGSESSVIILIGVIIII